MAQEHVTESCIQLKHQQEQEHTHDREEKDVLGSSIHLSRFKSVETSSSGQDDDTEAVSPSSSSNIVSPCDEEKGFASRRLKVHGPTESGDIKGIEVQPSRLL